MQILRSLIILNIILNVSLFAVAQKECKCIIRDSINENNTFISKDSIEIFNISKALISSNSKICQFQGFGLEFNYFASQKQLGKASEMLLEQEKLLGEMPCKDEYLYNLYANKSIFYQASEDLEKLSEFSFKALKEAEKIHDTNKEIEALKQIVYLFTRMRESNKNWAYIKRAERLITELEVTEKTIKHLRWLAFEYETKFVQTNRQTLIDSALIFINRAKNEAFKHQMYDEIAQFYRVLEATSYHKGELNKALKYIDSAIFYGKKIKGEKNLASFYLAKSWDHLDLGQFKDASKWIDTALYYDRPKGSAANMMMYFEASEIYQKSGNLKKGFESYKTYSKIKDSILNIERIEKVNELETKYKTELKDAEIKNLNQQQKIDLLELDKKQIQINKLIVLLIIAALIIISIILINKWVQLKKTRQKNRALQQAYDTQIRLEKELSDVRDNIAQDFHDDLGNKLARISLLSKLVNRDLKNKDEGIKSKIKQITDDANGLYLGTRDFIFSLKSNSDHIVELATYLSDFGEDYFSKTNIRFVLNKQIDNNKKLPHYWNKQLIYIFKEAMTNALKHAKCNTVMLNFEYRANLLIAECKDDGIGISEEHINSSNGLLNMKKRAEKIGGLLSIESTISHGTTIRFEGNTALSGSSLQSNLN